ncbi:ABC transporter ATP-binding protein [Arcanobacterium haemolyticum]|uniref:ATP-binding cassette domain-containing protein n=1 Tax=Arcanobacterium haemolyticum TaxID=28264 RepID=UPI0011102A76|nr:ABC transporter ATP-binding protein [Arcanobacterium haemolyticum]QCX47270.1 ABC transporter ATP-binding protein [Arcanobacterium haemolyticum]
MAFVGPNGSGKTTLIKLLLRFYEIDSGTILINELPIQNYSRENLYEKFSALFQDFVRYDLTLSENIRIGRVDNIGDEDRIYWALGEVGLKELLNRLPKGIDTTLGRKFDNGRELSIGQWQRIAAARALFREPKLLVLDEPTASVDNIAEQNMFESIVGQDRTSAKTTIVLVAHRPNTVRMASRIFVVNEGMIVASGTHSDLVRNCAIYNHLFPSD